MKSVTAEQLQEVVASYYDKENVISATSYGNGHINDTYLLICRDYKGEEVKVILQRLNSDVFVQPEKLMENIIGVTQYLRERIREEGGNPRRETLNLIPTIAGELYYTDTCNDYWRAYIFITDAVTYERVEKPEHFYESAVSFGRFQCLLANYPAKTLHETIKGFHDTAQRMEAFKQVIKEDRVGRVKDVAREIAFVLEREDIAGYLVSLQEKGDIPTRVTHNDTKLNNIMLDNQTQKGICVIDLDTVMPGLAVNDFGDSIRFGASTAAEDELDLSKVSCSMELFSLYTEGYIRGCQGKLTKEEIELLPMGAKMMTYECGMRFLGDYLSGDTYFRIHRAEHNLDRARTQFKLVADMEKKWDEMNWTVKCLS